MKNRIFAMAALAAVLFASCNKETEMINPAPEARPDGASVTITLSSGDDTADPRLLRCHGHGRGVGEEPLVALGLHVQYLG